MEKFVFFLFLVFYCLGLDLVFLFFSDNSGFLFFLFLRIVSLLDIFVIKSEDELWFLGVGKDLDELGK